jgi:hypothetical protein
MSSLPVREPLTDVPCDADRIGELVAALDEAQIGDGETSWIAEVLGVINDGRDLWIQVGRRHDPADTVVLRMSLWATARHALAALAALATAQSDHCPRIVRVMHAC